MASKPAILGMSAALLLLSIAIAPAAQAVISPTTALLMTRTAFATLKTDLTNVGNTYWATCTPTLTSGSGGDWGHCQTSTSTRGAKNILVVYCDTSVSGCTPTDGTNHAYLYDTSTATWGNSFAYYYVEFAHGTPGDQDSNIASEQGHSVYQTGDSVGQTLVQNEAGGNPSGYYEGGAEMHS